MDALAAAIARKRESNQNEFKGRKFVKRAELEELRIRKLRDEEAAERQKRVSCGATCLCTHSARASWTTALCPRRPDVRPALSQHTMLTVN